MDSRHVTLDGPDGSLLIAASTRETDVSREYWLSGDSPTGWNGGTSQKGSLEERESEGLFFQKRHPGGRSLELRVRIHLDNVEAAEWEKVLLSAALADGELGTLTVQSYSMPPLSMGVQRNGDVLFARVNPFTFDFSIPLLAPDPRKYGPWRESTLRPIGAGVGFEFPPFSRDLGKGPVATFGTAISTDEWVWNDGTAHSWPRFTVTANAPSGFMVALGDKRVTYPWPTFPDIPVTVDMAGAVTVGGFDQSHLLGERGWASIPPQSIETPHFEFLQGGTGWATVQHRDTYM